MEECKRVLLQCAVPEALVRLPQTKLRNEERNLMHEYFDVQKHGDLLEYLTLKLVEERPDESTFLQVCSRVPYSAKQKGTCC